jgi:hypothetical protein
MAVKDLYERRIDDAGWKHVFIHDRTVLGDGIVGGCVCQIRYGCASRSLCNDASISNAFRSTGFKIDELSEYRCECEFSQFAGGMACAIPNDSFVVVVRIDAR